jgi:mitofusin
LADGILNRYLEFQDFEQKFEECISKSAVRTKFERHSQRGKLIVSEIQQFVDRMYDQVQQLKTQKDVAKKELHDKLNITQQQLLFITQKMKDKIQQMVEDVKERVSCFRKTSVTYTEGTQLRVHVVLMSPCLLHQTSVCNEHCRATN